MIDNMEIPGISMSTDAPKTVPRKGALAVAVVVAADEAAEVVEAADVAEVEVVAEAGPLEEAA